MAMQDNYGTVSFLIAYLAIIWIFLFIIIFKNIKYRTFKQKNKVWIWTFLAYFFLAFGDIFHLGFRIYIFFGNLEFNSDFTKFLFGTGFVFTNITMTYFYIALLHAWSNLYGSKYSTPKKKKWYFIVVYITFIIRIPLIFLPYNHWFDYEFPLDFGFDFRIITALPLYLIGFITIGLLFKHSRAERNNFTGINIKVNEANYKASIWFIISFICFSLTTFLVVYIPLTGMFMIPKTVAYLIALYYHYKYLLSK